MTKPLDELNALEEAEAEELSGTPYLALQDKTAGKSKLFAALAFVHKRRSDPTLKFRDYAKTCGTLQNIDYLFDDPDEAEQVDDADELEDGESDPFPEGAPSEGAGAAGDEPADAEGAVLSGDGDPT